MSTKFKEITPKELLLQINRLIKEIFRYWYIILMACGLAAAYQFYQVKTTEIKYKAQVRFIVEGQNSSRSGIGGLLGSLGIRSNGKMNPFKLVEVAKSTNILKTVLSKRTSENQIFLANQIIEQYNLIDQWIEQNPDMNQFRFEKELYNRQLNSNENYALKKLHKICWGSPSNQSNNLLDVRYDDVTGIYSLSGITTNEELSYLLVTECYEAIRNFFEDRIYKNQIQITEILSKKIDSLSLARDNKTRELMSYKDRNQYSVSISPKANESILIQEERALNLALVELIKNKEMADINVKDSQPLFMSIDHPYFPLDIVKRSLLKSIALGIILASVLVIGFIILRKIYKDILRTE